MPYLQLQYIKWQAAEQSIGIIFNLKKIRTQRSRSPQLESIIANMVMVNVDLYSALSQSL